MMRSSTRNDRGAVLIEAAIITPLLLLLLFGILDWGVTLGYQADLAGATRSAARTAAALPRDESYVEAAADAVLANLQYSIPDDELQYLSIFRADRSTGAPVDGTQETCQTCYRFTYDPLTRAWIPVVGPEWPALDQFACGDTDDTDWVGVYVRIEHRFLTGVFGDTIHLEETTIMRLEPLPLAEECQPS